LVTLFLSFSLPISAKTSPLVKVKILEGQKVAVVGATGSYLLKGEEGQSLRVKSPFSLKKIKAGKKGITIEGRVWGKSLVIKPDKNSLTMVNGRRYRGTITIQEDNHSLTVINELPLEEYLYGVLKWEISPTWPLNAMTAQAIVARTFAFSRSNSGQENKSSCYLAADVTDQVYGGVESEDALVRIAVDLTRGEIITYQNQLIRAYYHCCCGGHTASSRQVWEKDLPYLRGSSDPFCADSPYYYWTILISEEELRALLKKTYPCLERILEVRPVSWDNGGRVEEVVLRHQRGRLWIKGTQFRQILGFNRLKSTRFQVKKTGDQFEFRGRGWGHGVGMCQWGAKEMAERGYTTEEILIFYYPGTRIKKIY